MHALLYLSVFNLITSFFVLYPLYKSKKNIIFLFILNVLLLLPVIKTTSAISIRNTAYSIKIYGSNNKVITVIWTFFATKKHILNNTKKAIMIIKNDKTIIGEIEKVEIPFIASLNEEDKKELENLIEETLNSK